VLGCPECSPDTPCSVYDNWGSLRTQTFEMLSNETLDKLKDKTLNKIQTLSRTNNTQCWLQSIKEDKQSLCCQWCDFFIYDDYRFRNDLKQLVE